MSDTQRPVENNPLPGPAISAEPVVVRDANLGDRSPIPMVEPKSGRTLYDLIYGGGIIALVLVGVAFLLSWWVVHSLCAPGGTVVVWKLIEYQKNDGKVIGTNPPDESKRMTVVMVDTADPSKYYSLEGKPNPNNITNAFPARYIPGLQNRQ